MLTKLKFLASRDKDVFDLLMSDKVRFCDSALRKIALERGLFLSPALKREDLAERISLLGHDHTSISKLIEMREHRSAAERRTFVEYPVKISREEAITVVNNYRQSVIGDEEVTLQTRRSNDLYINVTYADVDYSKTRLIQRQQKDAGIEIVLDEERTIFRLPASVAARNIVERMGDQLNSIKLAVIRPIEITLEHFRPEQRTAFFIAVISSVDGFRLKTVTGVKIASHDDSEDEALNFEEDEISSEVEVISQINNVALSGKNLIQTDLYKDLRRKGFFVTAITWQSFQDAPPADLFQFEISFDEPVEGKGLRFAVRSAKNRTDGEPSSNFRPLERNQQPAIWKVIEGACRRALKSLSDRASKEGIDQSPEGVE